MVAALKERADVVPFVTKQVPDSIVDRGLARVLDGRFGQRYLVGHAVATSVKRGRALGRRLKENPVDVILAVAASQDIAFLDTDIPVVQVSDTTFRAIKDFYPLFSNLNPLSEAQAAVQARRSARRTGHTLAATRWALDALLRDDAFRREDVTVAPFGPAVQPRGDEMPRPTTGPLRVLMVASDWDRKGGPDVLATWEELRRRGLEVDLTVVGDAPSLPEGIRRLGRVSPDQMRDLYASHHVLLELATNAAGVTLTDAAGFGLPTVAADTGGVSTIVDDGVTGFLVAPGAVNSAADQLTRLVDPSLRESVGLAARERADALLNWRAWGDAALRACQLALSTTASRKRGSASVARPGARDDSGTGPIVVLSPAIPYPGIEHAGGQYIRRLQEALQAHTRPTWMAMDRPSLRHSLRQPGVVKEIELLGDSEASSPLRRRSYAVADWVESKLGRLDPQPMPLAPALDVLLNPHVRRRIREARLLDFQWANYTKLSTLTRVLNPRARMHFTFHDVLSQKCDRSAEAATDSLRRARWRVSALLARRWERRAVSRADLCLVFSQKDKDLLDPSGRGNVVVIDPPLADGRPPTHLPNDDGHILFVGFMARQVNLDGLFWFLDEVWPTVLRQVPHSRLRVAGGAMPPAVHDRITARHPSVDVLGFVPDLDDEYSQAGAVVVPLRQGAGVKFKTIDALLQGVPVVTTSVGAEGIGSAGLFAGLADGPGEFADALVRVLQHNADAVAAARSAQEWAWGRYGVDRFHTTIGSLYF
ncbi:MAG TPA: glycosyltransferase [Arachnia sp.]|nr:glycosyltransferase [Arachnia sp.]